MNMKKILLVSLILLAILSSIAVVSAGWLDGMVECDSFKFKQPDGYSGSGEGDIISLQKADDDFIIVSEISEENYTDFMNTDFESEYSDYTSYGDDGSLTFSSVIFFNEINEPHMRIIVFKGSCCMVRAVMEKDGSFYSVLVQNPYKTEAIVDDVQICKDIYDSLERV